MEVSLEDNENPGDNLLFGDGDAMYIITTFLKVIILIFPLQKPSVVF